MTKEDFANIIVDEIEKQKEIILNNKKSINFYKEIGDIDNPILEKLEKEIKIAQKTIEELKKIILLPIYERIQNMTRSEIALYRLEKINEIKLEISKKEQEIRKIEHKIIELTEKIIKLEKMHKVTGLNKNIEDAKNYNNLKKQNLDKINLIKEEIEELINEIENIKSFDVKKELIQKFNLTEIENNIEIDNKLNEILILLEDNPSSRKIILNKLKEYNNLSKIENKEEITIPSTISKHKNISDFLINNTTTTTITDNKIEIYSIEEFKYLLNNIKKINEEFTGALNELKEIESIIKDNNLEYSWNIIDNIDVIYKSIYKVDDRSVKYDILQIIDAYGSLQIESDKLFKNTETKNNIINLKNKVNTLLRKVIDSFINEINNKLRVLYKKINLEFKPYSISNKNYFENYSDTFNKKIREEFEKIIEETNTLISTITKSKKDYTDNKLRKDFQISKIINDINNIVNMLDSNIKSITPKYYDKLLEILINDKFYEREVDLKKEEIINDVKETSKEKTIELSDLEEIKRQILEYYKKNNIIKK